MHEHLTTTYIRAPWRDWRRKHVKPLRDFLEERVRPSTLRYLFLAGISDAGVVLFDSGRGLADVLMAYAATWVCPNVVGSCLFVCGQDDKLMRRHAEAGAEAYGEEVFWVPGGHRWNSEYNPEYIAMMRSKVKGRGWNKT